MIRDRFHGQTAVGYHLLERHAIATLPKVLTRCRYRLAVLLDELSFSTLVLVHHDFEQVNDRGQLAGS